MRVEFVARLASLREAKTTAGDNVCRFKTRFVQVSGAAMYGIPPGLSGKANVGAGVREHVKRLGWKNRYDESTKLFDESLQKS